MLFCTNYWFNSNLKFLADFSVKTTNNISLFWAFYTITSPEPGDKLQMELSIMQTSERVKGLSEGRCMYKRPFHLKLENCVYELFINYKEVGLWTLLTMLNIATVFFLYMIGFKGF